MPGIPLPAEGRLSTAIDRALIAALAPAGLVRTGATHSENVAAQTARGLHIARRLLVPLLGKRNYLRLKSNAATGPSFGRRLGRIIAFGYDIGSIVHDSLGCGFGRRTEVAEISALFNLGIVLIDRLFDASAAVAVSTVITPDLLRQMPIALPGGTQLDAELRRTNGSGRAIVLTVVQAFFRRVRAMLPPDAPAPHHLGDLLVSAYEAELRTARPWPSRATARAIAERKAKAPFEIVFEVARLSEPAAPTSSIDRALAITKELATTFALVDDLADLERDQRAGDMNAIIIDGNGEIDWKYVTEAVERLGRSVTAAVVALESNCGSIAAARSTELVLTYLWSWIRPTSQPES
jgi:hypothetical protein